MPQRRSERAETHSERKSEAPPRRLRLSLEDLVEEKIREAQERGEFDDLPGKGRPVKLDDDPLVPPEVQMAHRLLANAGFAPDWIELAKEIEADLDRCRSLAQRGQEEEAQKLFQATVGKARLFNLKVPLFTMQRAIPRWEDLQRRKP